MKTVVILIGNSDDKLSQKEWSDFCYRINDLVVFYGKTVQFAGGSPSNKPWQNACYVFEMEEVNIKHVKNELSEMVYIYKQGSIAMIVGETEFIK